MTSLPGIAYGPGFPVIVTFDGKELLAYDADTEAPKWRLELARAVAGVIIADPTAVGPDDAGTPFRSGTLPLVVLAFDDEGRGHVIDPIGGRALREVEPAGAPRSIAATEVGGAVAIATANEVVLWSKGDKSTIPVKAWAVGFSHDGAMLGIGGEDGILRVYSVLEQKELVSIDVKDTSIVDIAHGSDGAWLVLTKRGLVRVRSKDDQSRIEKIPGGQRLRYDASGKRLAVQLSERQVLVYEWPGLGVLLRVEYTERPVTGMAFGSGDWMGVAMDHGDGNKINVADAKVHRTDTHPGRQHRSWTLYVEGKSKPKPQPTARTPVDDRPPPSLRNMAGGTGGRIGIGAVITFCLIGLRVCLRMSNTSSSSWNSSSYSGAYTTPTSTPSRCDRACAEERIQTLQKTCHEAGHSCETGASKALVALNAGKCTEAKAALENIRTDRANDPPLMGAEKLIAEMGLTEACADGTIRPKKIVHAKLEHLTGTKWQSAEKIPELRAGEGEKPRAVWTAPDGTVFVSTTARGGDGSTTAVIHRRNAKGTWDIVDDRKVAENDTEMQLFGRSASDVYGVVGGKLLHYNGTSWMPVVTPVSSVTNAAATASEIFVLGDGSDFTPEIHHGAGKTWAKDPKTSGLAIDKLLAGGSTVWASGTYQGDEAIARRDNGAWKAKEFNADAGALALLDAWASPSGDIFVSVTGAVYKTSATGAWVELPSEKTVRKMWGRSSADVYGIGFDGLLHYDGKKWSDVDGSPSDAVALSGSAKDLFVLRAEE